MNKSLKYVKYGNYPLSKPLDVLNEEYFPFDYEQVDCQLGIASFSNEDVDDLIAQPHLATSQNANHAFCTLARQLDKKQRNLNTPSVAPEHYNNNSFIPKNSTSNQQPSASTTNHSCSDSVQSTVLTKNNPLDGDATINRIYFNHKCFTGPSLSKSKISALPQYVGPGSLQLVMEEVLTKLISVAYVPPRILNDLSSDSFNELLRHHGLTNTRSWPFRAKYQKKTHMENIQVITNPENVDIYCELICEHLKCCYNLFGLEQFDGDYCPSSCRSLTKSNKFMKRPLYYREKARTGEYTGNESRISKFKSRKSKRGGKKKSTKTRPASPKPSTSKDVSADQYDESESEQSDDSDDDAKYDVDMSMYNNDTVKNKQKISPTPSTSKKSQRGESSSPALSNQSVLNNDTENTNATENLSSNPKSDLFNWTTVDVHAFLSKNNFVDFAVQLRDQDIDGPALMLLDNKILREHFLQPPIDNFTQADVDELARFVEGMKSGLA